MGLSTQLSDSPLFLSIHYKPSSVTNGSNFDNSHPLSSLNGWPLVIYLLRRSLAVSSNLPPDIGRAALNCRYTWSCNPRGAQPRSIATLAVGSYPTFSPLPHECGGYFLLHYYTLTSIKPLTCAVLCVARTFLPHPKVAATRRICWCKDSQKSLNAIACLKIYRARYSSAPRRLA